MGKGVKYVFITFGVLTLLFCAALLIVPHLIDVDKLKPRIEQLVSEKTGYPLKIMGTIDLSVFPWVGINFTDLVLNNPEDFQEKKFLSIKNFEARLKVLPLLSKRVEINRFIIDQPEVLLTRNDEGFWNWQGTGSASNNGRQEATGKREASQEQTESKPATQPEAPKQLGIQSLLVGEFALTNGKVVVDDQLNETTRELSDINLTLQDVSLDRPIFITLLAHFDDNPVELTGSFGPVTPDPLNSRIRIDIDIDLFKTLALNTSGYIENLASALSYDLAFKISSFSPRHLFSQLGLDFPAAATGPHAFESIEAKGTVSGTKSSIALSRSEIRFDESNLLAELRAKEFSKPDLEFHLKLDDIEIDRYLPAGKDGKGSKSTPESSKTTMPPGKKEGAAGESSSPTSPSVKSNSTEGQNSGNSLSAIEKKTDFEPLRKLVMSGDLSIDTIKMHGGIISNLMTAVDGKDGLFNLTSLNSDLYQGTISSTGYVDLRKAEPVSSVKLNIDNVQAGPLLRDFADKNIIEGTLQADIDLTGSGMTADQIKTSLNGKGELFFRDGAIIGIDLAHLARNIKSGFTLDQQGERPKTDFAELHAPFTITNGLVDTPKTTLKSPFIRVDGHGKADLVSETIDFRLTPKLVGTIKGQGDKEAHSGIAVPVIVGGTFEKPTFAPDLEALVREQGIDKKEISEILETGKISPQRKEQLGEEVEKAKTLLKGLFGN
jgi:AsmA protein